MDFFARQAETRRLSRWMVFLFILAVVAIVIAIDFVVVVAVAILAVEDGGLLATQDMSLAHYPMVVLVTSVVVIGTIGISSLVRTASLSSGGSAVAQSLGGTRVTADTTDPLRRRLINVVEEMSIASGTPMPLLYVLDEEPSINAFVAGLRAARRGNRQYIKHRQQQ